MRDVVAVFHERVTISRRVPRYVAAMRANANHVAVRNHEHVRIIFVLGVLSPQRPKQFRARWAAVVPLVLLSLVKKHVHFLTLVRRGGDVRCLPVPSPAHALFKLD